MSYSILPTKSELARELDRQTYLELVTWLQDNFELIEFFANQKCDRGARALMICVRRDAGKLEDKPQASTLIMLAEFRRALLQ